ncbi:putative snf5-domain-containing protein [Phialemonium atrogriseum]|uniref:Snf5-domain-containing protein n=1 Tax=Phialemonium atrogriseum TaxID=1093897 RepID=A0AAJ0FKC4_9PEZI|nr:putative snf5-domain-containing protein [Phialemonium atrogriseum]KAK1771461.1 putative snf5-domain-containing protein [Phialemonium atrogriseum]
MAGRAPPQGYISSYAPRLRTYNNSLLTPVLPNTAPSGPLARTTKRGTTIINYAEDGYDDYDYDDDDTRRRPTGLRSLRRDDSVSKVDPSEKVGKDTFEPVEVQGIWRDWMVRTRGPKSDAQNYAQACLPQTLIPIRIDVDVPSFIPAAPFPLVAPNVDPNNPVYKPQEMTVPYRLRDTFLWNLHETLMTTDVFAQTLVQDLDLPNRSAMIAEISKQIRTQLEEYAGVALHPLFHAQNHHNTAPGASKPATGHEPATPAPNHLSVSRADTPVGNVTMPSTPSKLAPTTPATVRTANGDITARASPIPPDSDDFSPDDTYRCIINLNINLSSQVYTDKFEWSLLHPPGTAEAFAKQTCADLGLVGEWVPAMTHAIYEAVLRLKKEACESGGLVSGWALGGVSSAADYPNDAAPTAGGEGAGWRYDPEHLADEWEPKIEILSKEEIEKREGDRERQIRRLRRETARFSSNTGMAGGVPAGFGFGGLIEQEEERMGRGERSKKKKRFRSLSPLGRSGTPGGRMTPDVGGAAGGYGGGGTLAENERATWRCAHCRIWGTSVWAVRDGPHGPRSLCNNCGFLFERDRKLPRWAKNLHLNDMRQF